MPFTCGTRDHQEKVGEPRCLPITTQQSNQMGLRQANYRQLPPNLADGRRGDIPDIALPRMSVARAILGRRATRARAAERGSLMADVLLFHHAHGLTSGVREFAEALRAAGHTVHVPDLYEGRVFDTLEDGVGYAQQVGFDTITARGRAAAAELPAALVYAGFSLGVLPAQLLAQTRPGARGALLYHACVPPTEFGDAWPREVPVQIHGMDADEFFVGEGDIEAARTLVATSPDAELFCYPGDQHLFADPSLPAYDRTAATLLTERTLAFLDRVG